MIMHMARGLWALLIFVVLAAPSALAQQCNPNTGYGTTFPQPSYVEQFWWDANTLFMLVKLTGCVASPPTNSAAVFGGAACKVYHGFAGVPRSVAQQFSQLKGSQTQAFYNSSLASRPESFLYEDNLAFCPVQHEDNISSPPGSTAYLATRPQLPFTPAPVISSNCILYTPTPRVCMLHTVDKNETIIYQ